MKGIFGLIGLLLALAVVGVLVKKQLAMTRQSVPALQVQVPSSPDPAASTATGTVKEQSQQIQQQYKQAIEAAMQPPRAVPEEQ